MSFLIHLKNIKFELKQSIVWWIVVSEINFSLLTVMIGSRPQWGHLQDQPVKRFHIRNSRLIDCCYISTAVAPQRVKEKQQSRDLVYRVVLGKNLGLPFQYR